MAWYGTAEVAKRLGVAESTVRRWGREGCPSAIGPTGARIYQLPAVQAWLADEDRDLDDEDAEEPEGDDGLDDSLGEEEPEGDDSEEE